MVSFDFVGVMLHPAGIITLPSSEILFWINWEFYVESEAADRQREGMLSPALITHTHRYDRRWDALLANERLLFRKTPRTETRKEEGRKERRWHKRITSELFCITHTHTLTKTSMSSQRCFLIGHQIAYQPNRQGWVLIPVVTHH